MKFQNFLVGFLLTLLLGMNSFANAQTPKKHSRKSHTSSVKRKSHKKKKRVAHHHADAIKTNNQAAEPAPEAYVEKKGTKSP